MRLLVAVAASFVSPLLIGGSAASGNPWNLRCAAMPTERAAPDRLQTAALRFFPWVRPAAKALHAGPVYIVALSRKTAISRDGDPTDSSGYYLHRAPNRGYRSDAPAASRSPHPAATSTPSGLHRHGSSAGI